MNKCMACPASTHRLLCHFCQRTVDLIKARRCVSCKAPVFDQDNQRVQGKCAECIGRNAPVGPATRLLLGKAARVRYAMRVAA